MPQTFREKWSEAVEKKGSVLCAGLDPGEHEEGKLSLPKGAHKEDWGTRYIKAVAPYCAAVKPNQKFWDGIRDSEHLSEVLNYARAEGLVIIYDCKAADIGSSNDEQFLHSQNRRFDAVTLALYAGNMEEAAQQLKKRGIGGIHMCLMTNPQYEKEKNKLVDISGEESEYKPGEIIDVRGTPHIRQYSYLAHNAKKFGLDGLVIGTTKHVQGYEIERVREYAGNQMLVLMPGVGAQGGEAEKIWKYFGTDDVIVNVGRGLMFPDKNPEATPEQQAAKAREYMDMLNRLRAAA